MAEVNAKRPRRSRRAGAPLGGGLPTGAALALCFAEALLYRHGGGRLESTAYGAAGWNFAIWLVARGSVAAGAARGGGGARRTGAGRWVREHALISDLVRWR